MRPVISAIVPSYNHERYVRRAIESALAQDVAELEVVVVDDASSDGTREIFEQLPGDPRLRIDLRDRNWGVSRTFNRGLELARGEYVAYVGSDDYWLPGHLSGAVDLLRDGRAAMVYGRVRLVDAQDRELDSEPALFDSVPDSRFFTALLARGNFVPFISAVMRREAAVSAGGFDENLVTLQDYDLWIRIAARHPVVFRDEVTAAFRWDGGNTSAPSPENSLRIRREVTLVLEKAMRELPEEIRRVGCEKVVRKQLATAYRRVARRLPSSVEQTDCFRRSLKADPYQPEVAFRYLLSWRRGAGH